MTIQADLFIPCIIDQFYPSIGWDMVKILEQAGCKVGYNPNQTCCGMPAYQHGHRESAKEVATKFLSDFAGEPFVVAPSASCLAMVKKYYDPFFRNTSNHNIYRRLQSNIKEMSEFLIDIVKVESLPSKLHAKVYYHHACHSCNDCGVIEQPIKLLSMVEGVELLYSDNPKGVCCGYSGEFSVNYESLAILMADQLIEKAIGMGADVFCSNEQFCLMHMDGIVKKRQLPLRVMHLAEVLASGF